MIKTTAIKKKRKRFNKAGASYSILINNKVIELPKLLTFEPSFDTADAYHSELFIDGVNILFKQSETSDNSFYLDSIFYEKQLYTNRIQSPIFDAKYTNIDLKNDVKTGYFCNINSIDIILQAPSIDKIDSIIKEKVLMPASKTIVVTILKS